MLRSRTLRWLVSLVCVAYPALSCLAQVEWISTVNGQTWAQGLEVDVETGDTVEFVDTFTNHSGGTMGVDLHQSFVTAEVSYIGHTATSGTVTQPDGEVRWALILGAWQSATLTVYFGADPCNWPESAIQRTWVNENQHRDVTLDKWLHALEIHSSYEPEVFSAQSAEFQLQPGNAGGYENNVQVWCSFSPEAPFGDSLPPADYVEPSGLTANWQLGDLANNNSTSIDVSIDVDGGLPVGTPVPTVCSIQDHTGALVANTTISQTTAATTLWETSVDSQPWFPGFMVVRETGDTIEVIEELYNRSDEAAQADLTQAFGPSQLSRVDASVSHGTLNMDPGSTEWSVQVPVGQTVTMTSLYIVEPCTWMETSANTVLAETAELRTIHVEKTAPELWLESTYDDQVVPGHQASIELHYGNSGGYENAVVLWCNLPDQAPFTESQPPPDFVDPDGHTARWDLGDLANGDSGAVALTVSVDGGLPPDVQIEISCQIFDHVDGLAGETVITLFTTDALAIFEDGFESGDSARWSDTVS